MIGIRMHLEEETVGTERPGCPGHGRHELAVTARLAAGGTGALYGECVQSMTTVEAIPSMSGMLRKSTTRLL